MTIGQRLKKFITSTYGTQKKFAESTGVSSILINKYINDNTLPGAEALRKFLNAGLSINWLLEGLGPMEAENNREDLVSKDDDSMNPINARIIKWILRNYNSIGNFASIFDIEEKYINEILNNEFVPDLDFINLMRTAGCNIRWIYSSEGEEFEDNYIGNLLKIRKNHESGNSPGNEGNNVDEHDRNFFEFLKTAAKKELNNDKEGSDDEKTE